MTNELIIPPAAKNNPSAREVLRGWITKQGLSLTIQAGTWPDAGMWGIALVDIARHVANGIHEQKGISAKYSLEQIKQTMFRVIEEKKK